MRRAVFGGTFDPIHLGHLLLAEACREQARLDQVWFMPAALSPHKVALRAPASAHDRAEMVRLAIGGHTPFQVSELELEREGLSYTVDTLETLRREYPQDEWFLLLGGDALADFPRWRAPARICELATPLVVSRPGATPPDLQLLAPFLPAAATTPPRESLLVNMPQVDISSTDIRDRVAQGHSIRFRVPRAVEAYIQAHGLYA